MQNGKDFSLFSREMKSGRVFYAQFRLPSGKWSTAKSTGVRDLGRKKDRDAAAAWAQAYLENGQVVTKERMTFGAFSEGFFDWEGDHVTDKLAAGRRLSARHAYQQSLVLKTHVLPYFKGMNLSRIDDEEILKWRRTLFRDGLAGATINHAMIVLRLILKAAYRKKYIRTLPVIESITKNSKTRGTFTPAEIRKIFAVEWRDARHKVANLLAATTGMRSSEVVGLQERHIHPDHIEVTQGWKGTYGVGPTKTGRPRVVPLIPQVYEAIRALLEANPWPSGPERWVFYTTSAERPLGQRALKESLDKAMAAAKVKPSGRRLDFHAWRHTFNSLLVESRVGTQIVQATTGHLTDAMTQHYYHESDEGLKQVREVQKKMLEEPKASAPAEQ